MTMTQAERDAAVDEILTRHSLPHDDALSEAVDEVIYQATNTEDRMDPGVKAEWVRRLRSGDYEQGNGFLRNQYDEYCCLGVLCEVVEPDKWVQPTKEGDAWTHDEVVESLTMPSFHVLIKAGIPEQGPSAPDALTSAVQSLASVNDRGGSFALIADLIEEYL